MITKMNVALVSVFGRGNWLAAELADMGLDVTLVDVSNSLGRWTPEDWEGPFGLFHSEKLSALQVARLHEEDDEDSIDEGFTVWLKDGPLDFKGPISSFLLQQQGIPQDCIDYLNGSEIKQKVSETKLLRYIQDLGFRKNWIVNLAHQLASNTMVENSASLWVGKPLPLFSPYSVRRVSRSGQKRSLDWLRDKGIQVLDAANIKDISIEGGRCEGLEIQSDWSGGIRADNFIWQLSSEETSRFTKVCSSLFPKGIVESEWGWVRYRVHIEECDALQSLPHKFLMMEDVDLPWAHTNLCLVQKSVSDLDWDFWVRIPTQHRFRRSYIEGVGQQLIHQIVDRLPKAKAEILNMPQDYYYDRSELGPPRFPVYNPDELKNLQVNGAKNIYFDGPEQWVRQDWTGQFDHQNLILEKIKWQFNKNRPAGNRSRGAEI